MIKLFILVDNEIIPPITSSVPDDNVPSDNELVIREDGDIINSSSSYSSTIHVTPAASLNVKTFISSTTPDEKNSEFEKDFLRAVDRALGVNNKDQNHLLQPVYDTPMNIDDKDINIVEITERALSSFKNTKFITDEEQKNGKNKKKLSKRNFNLWKFS